MTYQRMKKLLIIESSNGSYCTLFVVCEVILARLKLTCYNCTFTSKHKKCMYVMFCMYAKLAISQSAIGHFKIAVETGSVLSRISPWDCFAGRI